MSQMERGERPAMQEQEDSEEGETPTDPSAGEWQMNGCPRALHPGPSSSQVATVWGATVREDLKSMI